MLKQHPDLNIQVYTVWFSMLKSDTPAAFPEARKVMPDRRVRHYWDSSRNVGRWFRDAVPSDYEGPIQWDAFYLYAADAVWTDKPQPQLTWGRPILEVRQRLADQIAALTSGR